MYALGSELTLEVKLCLLWSVCPGLIGYTACVCCEGHASECSGVRAYDNTFPAVSVEKKLKNGKKILKRKSALKQKQVIILF